MIFSLFLLLRNHFFLFQTKTDNSLIKDVEAGGLDGEKQMLKNEVRVLNNELSLLLHRTRAAEKGIVILAVRSRSGTDITFSFEVLGIKNHHPFKSILMIDRYFIDLCT